MALGRTVKLARMRLAESHSHPFRHPSEICVFTLRLPGPGKLPIGLGSQIRNNGQGCHGHGSRSFAGPRLPSQRQALRAMCGIGSGESRKGGGGGGGRGVGISIFALALHAPPWVGLASACDAGLRRGGNAAESTRPAAGVRQICSARRRLSSRADGERMKGARCKPGASWWDGRAYIRGGVFGLGVVLPRSVQGSGRAEPARTSLNLNRTQVLNSNKIAITHHSGWMEILIHCEGFGRFRGSENFALNRTWTGPRQHYLGGMADSMRGGELLAARMVVVVMQSAHCVVGGGVMAIDRLEKSAGRRGGRSRIDFRANSAVVRALDVGSERAGDALKQLGQSTTRVTPRASGRRLSEKDGRKIVVSCCFPSLTGCLPRTTSSVLHAFFTGAIYASNMEAAH
ncbi:hypothetical protein C8J57DRAFT_1229635 [Mycena rebaudengoi]|nr:hypothetical protein C8J57DRAFT_1229635 [Mycena rebaudengoi]